VIMQIKIDTNLDQLAQKFRGFEKQVRFAAAKTMTRMAVEARDDVKAQLPSIFDNPTQWTTNSMRVSKATPRKLEAAVWFKDGGTSDRKADLHYLISQIQGGERRLTRFEGRFRMHGYITGKEKLLPTKYADINPFGNVSNGQRTKILSQLRTAVVAGDYSNASDSKRSKAKRAITQYFWSSGPGQPSRARPGRKDHLMRGVWEVRRTAFGNAVRPVFLVASPSFVRYARRFAFAGIVNRSTRNKFDRVFTEEFRNALATARYEHQLKFF